MSALYLAPCIAGGLSIVLVYAVWAARDVVLKRMHNDARMDALEAKCNKAIENMAKEMRAAIEPMQQRVQHLETKGAGNALAAQQAWRR